LENGSREGSKINVATRTLTLVKTGNFDYSERINWRCMIATSIPFMEE
jgi:hypothetical protein